MNQIEVITIVLLCVCVGFEILVVEKLLYVDTWNNLLPIPACGKKSIILIIVISGFNPFMHRWNVFVHSPATFDTV